MPRTLIIVALFLPAACLTLTSCATVSHIETSWKVPAYEGKVFSELAIIAIMKNHDESKAFELAATEEFSKVGVDAVAGFTFLGSDTLLPQDELQKRVETTGADGVLIFKLIGEATIRNRS